MIKNLIIKKLFLLLFFLLLLFFINYYYYINYIDFRPEIINQNGQLNLLSIDFGYGEATFNLVNNNELFYESGLNKSKQYLARMPLIPIFIKFVYVNISKKLFIIILIKNLFFFFSIIFLSHLIFKNYLHTIIIFFIITYNFHNITIITALSPEEGFLGYLMILLFLSIFLKNNNKYLVISIILSAVFFLKASMVFLCYIISILIGYIGYKKKDKLYFFPALIVFCSYLIWSIHGFIKTNQFIKPFSLSSISGQTINIAYNEYFNSIYPNQSADILEGYIFDKFKKTHNNYKNYSEIEIDEAFTKDSINFIKNNPKEVSFSFLKKIYNIFFNLKFDGKNLEDENYNKIRYSNIPNKICLNLMIYIILYNFFKKKIFKTNDIIFFAIIISYLFPYMIGFVYSRQIVPIYILAHIYIYFYIINKWKKSY